MDKWMIGLDPNIAVVFDASYDALEAAKKAMPNNREGFDAAEQKLVQQAKELAQGKGAAPKAAAQAAGENGKLPVAGSYDIGGDLPPKTFPLTKYGKITFTATTKLSVSNANAGDTAAGGGASTKFDPKKGAQTGVAMGASVGLGDFDLFEGVDLEGLSLKFQNTFDAEKVEISFGVEGSVNFKGIKKVVKVSGEVKLLSLEIAEGKLSPIEGTFAVGPFSIDTTIKGVKVTGECSCKATIAPDKEKVAAQVAKKVIVDLIEKEVEKEVEKEAAKQGAKMVAAQVAKQALSKLGPLMTAFSVGYAAGEILTKFTHAGQTAEAVDGAVLDGYKKRFDDSGTAGKVAYTVAYSPVIAATLVASGVAGTVEGIGELGSKAYHGIKDRFSETEVDQAALAAAQKTMDEELDKHIAEEEESELSTRYSSVAHDDPPPPPPPTAGPAKRPGH
jgi:hypothetical protein